MDVKSEHVVIFRHCRASVHCHNNYTWDKNAKSNKFDVTQDSFDGAEGIKAHVSLLAELNKIN